MRRGKQVPRPGPCGGWSRSESGGLSFCEPSPGFLLHLTSSFYVLSNSFHLFSLPPVYFNRPFLLPINNSSLFHFRSVPFLFLFPASLTGMQPSLFPKHILSNPIFVTSAVFLILTS